MNAIGYQVFFSTYRFKINNNLDNKIIEGNLTGFDKIIFKAPVISLPYLPSKPFVSDLTGELMYKGNTYRYVKSTLIKDTIYYECVLNIKSNEISSALSDFIKLNNGEHNSSKKAAGFGQKLFKDYLPNSTISLPIIICTNLKKNKYKHYNSSLTVFTVDNPSPPPQSFC